VPEILKTLRVENWVIVWPSERLSQKSLPPSLFQREESPFP
jgi:hypothetical protein